MSTNKEFKSFMTGRLKRVQAVGFVMIGVGISHLIHLLWLDESAQLVLLFLTSLAVSIFSILVVYEIYSRVRTRKTISSVRNELVSSFVEAMETLEVHRDAPIHERSPRSHDSIFLDKDSDERRIHRKYKLLSQGAFESLKDRVSEYIIEIVDQSYRISRHQSVDIISAVHVNRAAEHLIATPARKVYRYIGAVGGVFFGVSLSSVVTYFGSTGPSQTLAIFAILFGIISAFMISCSFFNE